MQETAEATQTRLFPPPHGPLREVSGPDDLETAVRVLGPDADVSGIARAARAFLVRVEHILDFPYDSFAADGWLERRPDGTDGAQRWHLEVRYETEGRFADEPVRDLYRAIAEVTLPRGAVDARVDLTFEDCYENGATSRRVTIPIPGAGEPSVPALLGIERFFYEAQVRIIEGVRERRPRLDRSIDPGYFGYARSSSDKEPSDS